MTKRAGNTVQLGISLPKELAEQIKTEAARDERTVSNWCMRALRRALEEVDDGR